MKIRTSNELGSQLKSLREGLQLSQAELGAKVGLSQTRISRIESDPAKVSVDQLLTLLMILGGDLMVEKRSSDRRMVNASTTIRPDLAGDNKEAKKTKESMKENW